MLEDLIVALKIVTPDSNKNNSAASDGSTGSSDKDKIKDNSGLTQSDSSTPMDGVIEGEGQPASADASSQPKEVEMVSDVDCSISEND